MASEIKRVTQLSWIKFLSTESGRDGLLYLNEHVPSISSGDPHHIIFGAGKVEGYKMALQVISDVIANSPEKKTSIDDDFQMEK